MPRFRQVAFTNLPLVVVVALIVALTLIMILVVGIRGEPLFILLGLAGAGAMIASWLRLRGSHRIGGVIVSTVILAIFVTLFPGVAELVLLSTAGGAIVGGLVYWQQKRRCGKRS